MTESTQKASEGTEYCSNNNSDVTGIPISNAYLAEVTSDLQARE